MLFSISRAKLLPNKSHPSIDFHQGLDSFKEAHHWFQWRNFIDFFKGFLIITALSKIKERANIACCIDWLSKWHGSFRDIWRSFAVFRLNWGLSWSNCGLWLLSLDLLLWLAVDCFTFNLCDFKVESDTDFVNPTFRSHKVRGFADLKSLFLDFTSCGVHFVVLDVVAIPALKSFVSYWIICFFAFC